MHSLREIELYATYMALVCLRYEKLKISAGIEDFLSSGYNLQNISLAELLSVIDSLLQGAPSLFQAKCQTQAKFKPSLRALIARKKKNKAGFKRHTKCSVKKLNIIDFLPGIFMC